MRSHQIAIRNRTDVTMPQAWRVPVARRSATAISAMVNRAGAAVGHWARIPYLPYAVLWEASVLVGALQTSESFEPAGNAEGGQFLSLSWPHD